MEQNIVFLEHALLRARERDIPKRLQQIFLTPMADIHYDPKSNILRIRTAKRKSADSDVSGNVVIDYDKNGKVTNIEIMDVSMDEFAHVEEGVAQMKHAGRERARTLAYAA